MVRSPPPSPHPTEHGTAQHTTGQHGTADTALRHCREHCTQPQAKCVLY